MKKIFCLRDDDTNYFTRINELIEGYGEIWGKYPITLATIPFVHGSESKILEYDLCPNKFELLDCWEKAATVNELTQYHKTYPIGENEELVLELKKQILAGKIEIAQHGVHHRYNINGAELKHVNVAISSIKQGRDYLNKVFETEIKVMIPPSNTIDSIVTKEVSELGMNLLCSGPIKFDNKYQKYFYFLKKPDDLINGVYTKLHKGLPLRKRQGLYISDSFTFDISKSDDFVYDNIVARLNKYGYYSMTTHYRLLSNVEYRNRYINMVNRIASNNDVEFLCASDYFSRIINSIGL